MLKKESFMTLVKDDKADFVGEQLQWGFVVGKRDGAQL